MQLSKMIVCCLAVDVSGTCDLVRSKVCKKERLQISFTIPYLLADASLTEDVVLPTNMLAPL